MATTVNAYLTFNGTCEEAFNLYKSVFGGKFPYVGRFKDMPSHDGEKPTPEGWGDKIMHISLPISKETTLMGSDTSQEWAPEVTIGNNITLSVNTQNEAEAERIFNALAEGGKIKMPLEKTFWQAYFGMLTDKFGINWMVNCELESHKNFEEENR